MNNICADRYDDERYDDRYLRTLHDYKLHNPTSSKRMVVWCPSGYYDIEVTLDDGSRWLYDYATSGMRCIVRNSDHKIYENEEEYTWQVACTLRKRIRDAGFTQTAFADACGIKHATLRNYITGKTLPNLFAAKRMAAVLGCAPTALMDFE